MKLRLTVEQKAIDVEEALALAVHADSLLVGLSCSGHDATLHLTAFVDHSDRPAVANLMGLHAYELLRVEGIRGVEDGTNMVFSRTVRCAGVPF